ncbi:MAG: nucleoside-diphosphate kinase [Chloroflexi bacterium]|nr:nucleoside-diphosphate kinase [Chloroflexota bacterium]
MSTPERTLVLAKPDAVQRGLAGEIITRLERTGLRLVGLKLLHIDMALARKHYAVHEDKPFFDGLVKFITSSPVVAMVWEGPRAVEVVRKTMGATDPAKSAPGSLRGDFGLTIGMNLVHGSDSPENAAKEVALFFKPNELVTYKRDIERWVIE